MRAVIMQSMSEMFPKLVAEIRPTILTNVELLLKCCQILHKLELMSDSSVKYNEVVKRSLNMCLNMVERPFDCRTEQFNEKTLKPLLRKIMEKQKDEIPVLRKQLNQIVKELSRETQVEASSAKFKIKQNQSYRIQKFDDFYYQIQKLYQMIHKAQFPQYLCLLEQQLAQLANVSGSLASSLIGRILEVMGKEYNGKLSRILEKDPNTDPDSYFGQVYRFSKMGLKVLIAKLPKFIKPELSKLQFEFFCEKCEANLGKSLIDLRTALIEAGTLAETESDVITAETNLELAIQLSKQLNISDPDLYFRFAKLELEIGYFHRAESFFSQYSEARKEEVKERSIETDCYQAWCLYKIRRYKESSQLCEDIQRGVQKIQKSEEKFLKIAKVCHILSLYYNYNGYQLEKQDIDSLIQKKKHKIGCQCIPNSALFLELLPLVENVYKEDPKKIAKFKKNYGFKEHQLSRSPKSELYKPLLTQRKTVQKTLKIIFLTYQRTDQAVLKELAYQEVKQASTWFPFHSGIEEERVFLALEGEEVRNRLNSILQSNEISLIKHYLAYLLYIANSKVIPKHAGLKQGSILYLAIPQRRKLAQILIKCEGGQRFFLNGFYQAYFAQSRAKQNIEFKGVILEIKLAWNEVPHYYAKQREENKVILLPYLSFYIEKQQKLPNMQVKTISAFERRGLNLLRFDRIEKPQIVLLNFSFESGIETEIDFTFEHLVFHFQDHFILKCDTIADFISGFQIEQTVILIVARVVWKEVVRRTQMSKVKMHLIILTEYPRPFYSKQIKPHHLLSCAQSNVSGLSKRVEGILKRKS